MKKVFILGFVIATFLSCSTDDLTNEEFHAEFLPIESVTLPEEMHYNDSYIITYTYYKPTSCHLFNDLFYLSEDNFRTVAVISKVLKAVNNVVCETLTDELVERSFIFYCDKNAGTFIFKFWQGEDENGQDIYLINEVPIVN